MQPPGSAEPQGTTLAHAASPLPHCVRPGRGERHYAENMEDDGAFTDPVLELARRTGGDDLLSVFEVETTDAEAEIVLAALDEIEAETSASGIASRLREMGHAL